MNELSKNAPRLVVSSGLWISQGPGAESVGGVSLALYPSQKGAGEWLVDSPWLARPDDWPSDCTGILLGLFTHPVDTRPSSMQRALSMALEGLPPPQGLLQPHIRPVSADFEWMGQPQRRPFTPTLAIWSRVRRYQPNWTVGPDRRFAAKGGHSETLLQWVPGEPEPTCESTNDSERDYLVAWMQAQLAVQSLDLEPL